MNESDYILSFNLQETSDQIFNVGKAYTELGETVRSVSNATLTDVKDIQDRVSQVTANLSVLSSTLDLAFLGLNKHLSATDDILGDMAKKSSEIASNFSKLGSSVRDVAMSASLPTVAAGSLVSDILPHGAAKNVEGSDDVVADKEAEEASKKQERRDKKSLTKSKALLLGEARSLKSAVGRLLSKGSMGMIGGGIVAGSVAAMILGATEKDRKAAQKGEVINVLEGTGEDLFSRPVKRAARYFANFQEKAQYHYAIGRKEIQGVLKQVVDAGFSATEMTARLDKSLGKVGDNAVTATLALDKHLNRATGSAMREAIEVTRNYGDSLHSATRLMINLNIFAQQSGAGIEKFTQAVNSGGASLVQYGIDLKDVLAMTKQMEKHYSNMGLNKQFAGTLGAQATQSLTSGLGGLGTEMKALLGSEMGLGQGWSAIQAVEEGWRAVLEGKKKGRLQEMLLALGRVVDKQGPASENRAAQIKFLEHGGISNAGATAFIDIKNQGGLASLADGSALSDQNIGKLKKAFKTEGQQLSELQKNQRDIIDGIAKIGQGLIGIVGNLIAVIITAMRSLPALIDYASEKLNPLGDAKRADRILDKLGEMFSSAGSGIQDSIHLLEEGAKQTGQAMLAQVYHVMGKNVKNAVDADLSGYDQDTLYDKAGKLRLKSEAAVAKFEELQREYEFFAKDKLVAGSKYAEAQAAKVKDQLEAARLEAIKITEEAVEAQKKVVKAAYEQADRDTWGRVLTQPGGGPAPEIEVPAPMKSLRGNPDAAVQHTFIIPGDDLVKALKGKQSTSIAPVLQ